MGKRADFGVGQQQDSCVDKEGARTRLLFMTDGLLLAWLRGDKQLLQGISVVIIDEAHERGSNSDLVLALVRCACVSYV